MIGKQAPRRLKAGDELIIDWLNALRDAAVEGSISHLGPGISGSPTPNGWSIGVSEVSSRAGFLAKTNGTISARSGTALGTGSVFLTTISGSTITVTSNTQTVFNFSSTSGGIATATYVWVEEDDAGNYFITAVDCG